MSVPYECCTKKFEEHYAGQTGSGLPYYKGVSVQKGYGLGGIFRRLFKAAFPFLMKGTKTIGKEALLTGSRVASDVLSGQNFKEAIKTRTKESGKNLTQKALDKVQSMVGRGKYKRKRTKQKRIISSKVRKVRGRDIFDP
jgi:hypothetical protein